jgi:predicted nuclease of restriction endonuclease-like (RecB) superfamily
MYVYIYSLQLSTPLAKAKVRYWTRFAHEKIVSNFYKILMVSAQNKQNKNKQKQSLKEQREDKTNETIMNKTKKV